MSYLVTNQAEAIAIALSVPSVVSVFKTSETTWMGMLVDMTAGTFATLPGVAYRPWMAAYRYLQQCPALWRVKVHDSTELGDPKPMLEMLLSMQASYDRLHKIVPPPGQTAIALTPIAVAGTRDGIGSYWEPALKAAVLAPEQQSITREYGSRFNQGV